MLNHLLRASLFCAGLLTMALPAQADTVQNAIDYAVAHQKA